MWYRPLSDRISPIEKWSREVYSGTDESKEEILRHRKLFENRVPSLEVPTTDKDKECEEEIHDQYVSPEDHGFSVGCIEREYRKELTQSSDKKAPCSFCPGLEPRFLKCWKECDKVYDNRKYRSVFEILKNKKIENTCKREKYTEIIEPIDRYFSDSSYPYDRLSQETHPED
jgi:hypothetical protein